MKYALVDQNDAILRIEDRDSPPPPLAPAKGLRWLPVVDEPPPAPPLGHVVERDGWAVGETTASPRWVTRALTDDERAAALAARRADKIADINAERDRRMGLGVAHAGKRFSIDDSTRTNLGGMATTAVLVQLGFLSWPDEYARGWIALDNTRLLLPTPQDGVALAAAAGNAYAGLVQHARDLKDAALVAADLDHIDAAEGWPGD